MNFRQKLENIINKNNSLLCIGLDPDPAKLPDSILEKNEPLFEFNKAIIDATYNLVCAYKPNSAFYEAQGAKGIEQLKKTIDYIKKQFPDIPVILDAKRGDIASTSEHYAKFAFDYLNADAITVNPYLGLDAIEPFLKRTDKGIIILCRTSNPSAKDFQDLTIGNELLYIIVAKKIIEWNNTHNNCLMVIGATYPKELKIIRALAPKMFFLVPGIGVQGGDLEQTLSAGLRTDKSGLIIHTSRSIIYASSGTNFAQKAKEEALKLRNQINLYRK